MAEYFIKAHSFAAPFVSDSSTHYIEGDSPREALENFAANVYNHPSGLYAANLYASADDMHKGNEPLAKYRSDKEIAISEAVREKGAATVDSGPSGTFIDGNRLNLGKNQKAGRVIDE